MSREEEERFVTTHPFTIHVTQGPLGIDLAGVRICGKVFTQEGHDHMEGTLSFESATLFSGETEFEYDGGTTTFIGRYAPEEVVPEGAPDICNDICGAVVLGQCDPPNGFPPDEFCQTEED